MKCYGSIDLMSNDKTRFSHLRLAITINSHILLGGPTFYWGAQPPRAPSYLLPWYIYTVLYTGAAPGFWFEGEHQQTFHTEFLLSPVLLWRLQNFGSGEHSAQMYSSKTKV